MCPWPTSLSNKGRKIRRLKGELYSRYSLRVCLRTPWTYKNQNLPKHLLLQTEEWQRSLTSYLQILWLFRAIFMFILELLEEFPGLIGFVESLKILGWLSLFLFIITSCCFCVFVGCNFYTRLTVEPWKSKRELHVCICVYMHLTTCTG